MDAVADPRNIGFLSFFVDVLDQGCEPSLFTLEECLADSIAVQLFAQSSVLIDKELEFVLFNHHSVFERVTKAF